MRPFRPGAAFWLRIAVVTVVVAVLALGSVIQGQAHATFVRSDPPDNGVVASPPTVIKIWYSEPIAPNFSTAQMLDLNGKQVLLKSIQFDQTDPTVLILVPPLLGDGVYTVTWRAASASDAHATRGLFVFRVGAASAVAGGSQATAAAADSTPLSIPEVALRWLNYFGLLAMLGAAGIPLLVIRSSAAQAEEPGLGPFYRSLPRRIYTLGALAGAFVFSVELLYLAWQITSLTGNDPNAAPQDAVGQMLFHTTWGYAWIARQALTAVLIPLFTGLARASDTGSMAAEVDSIPAEVNSTTAEVNSTTAEVNSTTEGPAKWLKRLAFVLVSGALAAQAFTSHAAGGRDPAFSIFIDWLHLVFVGLWVGGLFTLGVSILPVLRKEAIDFKTIARSTWGRFGPLAALSVGVVVATGLYATGQRVISADALLMTTYGQLLAAKIALMLLAGLAGLLNSLSLHPALSAPVARWLKKPPGWTPFSIRRLPALILVEMGLGIVIALLVGALTTLPPASDMLYTIAPESQPDAMTAQVDDLYVNLAIKPNRPGPNIINILSSSSRRPAPAAVLRVIVKMTYLEQDFGAISTDALPSGLDAYRASLDSLTQPGRWKIDVVVRRKGIPDSVASFTWTVLPLGDLRPTLVSRSPWKDALSILAALLALLVAALFGGAWFQKRTPHRTASPPANQGYLIQDK